MSATAGIDGLAVYPEYLTDPAIELCPSDSLANFRGDLSVGAGRFAGTTDYLQMIKQAAQSTSEAPNPGPLPTVFGTPGTQDNAARACLASLTGMLPSYGYLPYVTSTYAEVKDVLQAMYITRAGAVAATPGAQGIVQTWSENNSGTNPAQMRYNSCGFATDLSNPLPDPLDAATPRAGGVFALLDSPATTPVNDDGTALPASYYKLKEGVERFKITDINNSAGSAKAQSSIPIMLDAYGQAQTVLLITTGGITVTNHIPGGSNVLYMDGHVSWIKYKDGTPVGTGPAGTFGVNLPLWTGSTMGKG
ncbi:MAG: hypothetical protein HZB26_11150 [Candidatus Hydrogenedentes bacterium]|nr:hypothetical protein [Candidatus Hydrogenedentota bacterium]